MRKKESSNSFDVVILISLRGFQVKEERGICSKDLLDVLKDLREFAGLHHSGHWRIK